MKAHLIKCLSLLSVLFLTGCNNSPKIPSSDPGKSEPTPVIKNLLPEEGTYSRFTDYQKAYLEREDYSDTSPFSGNLSREDVSLPKPVELSWEIENLSCNNYRIDIFKGDNKVISYLSEETNFKFYNTEVGASYTYKVAALDESEKEIVTSDMSPVFSIENKGPRHLYVDGVENMRDLGGWGYIKQGMIYRSGRFNEDKKTEPTISVTEKGLKELKEYLHIKTEIDLRRTATNEVGGLTDKSVLGDDVKYIQLPMLYEGKNILTYVGKANSDDGYTYDNPLAIKSFFETLADQNNYPVVFHCSIGKDRTGCCAFLLEGLMGFDIETMYRDYMFTNFSNAGFCKLQDDVINRYGKTLSDYENGDNINEKTYNYLNEVIGVSKESLDKIKTILGA